MTQAPELYGAAIDAVSGLTSLVVSAALPVLRTELETTNERLGSHSMMLASQSDRILHAREYAELLHREATEKILTTAAYVDERDAATAQALTEAEAAIADLQEQAYDLRGQVRQLQLDLADALTVTRLLTDLYTKRDQPAAEEKAAPAPIYGTSGTIRIGGMTFHQAGLDELSAAYAKNPEPTPLGRFLGETVSSSAPEPKVDPCKGPCCDVCNPCCECGWER